jgi:hypothetical protein
MAWTPTSSRTAWYSFTAWCYCNRRLHVKIAVAVLKALPTFFAWNMVLSQQVCMHSSINTQLLHVELCIQIRKNAFYLSKEDLGGVMGKRSRRGNQRRHSQNVLNVAAATWKGLNRPRAFKVSHELALRQLEGNLSGLGFLIHHQRDPERALKEEELPFALLQHLERSCLHHQG